MKKIFFLFLILFAPSACLADRGMVVWPEGGVSLDQTTQNAIISWNGTEEVMILTTDVSASASSSVLRIIPFPSQPVIKEGSIDSFTKLVEIVNQNVAAPTFLNQGEKRAGGQPGVEIVFHDTVAGHDLTTVKVNKLDDFLAWMTQYEVLRNLPAKEISQDFKDGIGNYLKKGINYFVFDTVSLDKAVKTSQPLIYRFSSEYLYYPFLISAISDIGKSQAVFDLFLIMDKTHSLVSFDYDTFGMEDRSYFELVVSKKNLEAVSSDILDLYKNNPDPEMRLIKLKFTGEVGKLKKDLMLYSSDYWDRYMYQGMSGEKVKAMQKILINENDIWQSPAGATGYFGPATKSALMKFQERHIPEYLSANKFKSGTGIFWLITQSYYKKISLFKYDKL